MSALTGEALAERLATLTEEATEEAKAAIINLCFDKSKGATDGVDLPQQASHARHMMVLVIAELFASAIQGVIDEGREGLLQAANNMVAQMVGPQLVALHKAATK